ncbi:MAG: sulfatase-like hydrolase/transferase [bacterium]|nr:sulfatase-like hydrolase/transferase [bacterium]
MTETSANSIAQSTRRRFLKTAVAAGAAAPLAQFSRNAAAASGKRNIIFILIDDMRFDSMSCMGHPFLKTPNLDRLAGGGVLFNHAYVTTSLCSPSRASILSGQYAHQHGVLDNSTLLPKGTPIFPIELQKNGYDTGFIGKWHMGGSSDEPRPGFDRWVSFRGQGVYINPTFNIDGKQVKRDGYVTDLLTDYAEDFIKQDREKPFFLYLSHKAVHADFYPAERHKKAFSDIKIEHPASMADTPENYEGKPLWVKRQRHSWHGVDYMYHDQTDFDNFILDYNRTMLAVDDSVGRVMDTLEKQGLLDDTLILLMSDNGFLHGEHGLIDKRCMYEESIRVPLLAHCPNLFDGGRRTDRIALNIDIAPTILEAAGVSIPDTVQGESFMRVLKDDDANWREGMLYEYFWERAFPQTPTVFGVRTERYKYMNFHGIFDLDELYDLEKDPHEMHNLIDDAAYHDVRVDMEKRLRDLLKETEADMVPSFKAGS